MPPDHRPRETFSEYGIVLRTSALGESDALLTVLLETRGKIPAVARGIKRSRKRFMGGLDLFDAGLFVMEERGAEDRFPVISGISNRRSFPRLSSNLAAFAVGSLGLEVVNQFALDRDPEGSLYLEPLLACLQTLEDPAASQLGASTRLLFEILSKAGFSEFETLSTSHPEVTVWLLNPQTALPTEDVLGALLTELVRSIEIILSRELSTKDTLRRVFGRRLSV